ncbi:PHP domain-containing protein [Devosia sp. A449]
MPIDPAFSTPGQFYKGNLHTHSTRSDGKRSPAEVCAMYRDAGYDFLALTDHFTSNFNFPIVDTSQWRTDGFTTLFGAEMHAPNINAGELWHILAVGLPLDFSGLADDETGPQLAQRCLDAGAFVAFAHPTWYGLDMDDAASIPGAMAAEIYNHTTMVRTSRGDSSLFIDQLLNRGRHIGIVATDDAHFESPDWFGGFVMVKASARAPEALLEALKAGHYYASQGPQIHDITYTDTTVEIHCSAAAAVMVLGKGSRSAQRVEPNLTRVSLPIDRVRAGGYARIVVVDAQGRKAWSNPAWF